MMLQPLQSAVNVNRIQSNMSSTGMGGSPILAGNAITNSLDYDDFLTLLVMQLKYQDPLNPLENNEFLAQTAQFSTVEQLIAIKDSMEAQKAATDVANASYATNMIGKLVAADVSTYDSEGNFEERYITGIVSEVTFIREEGAIIVRLDDGAAVYLQQIISVREPEAE